MASICKDPGGRKRLLFTNADGVRKVIRLGEATMKQAVEVRLKVEALIGAKLRRVPVDDEASRWVGGLPDKMYRRFVRVGLAEPREAARSVMLGELLERYRDSRTGSIKPSTILVHDQARQSLLEYFGADRPAKDIHEGDAELWASWMAKQGLAEATRRKRAQNAKQFFAFAVRQRIVPTNPFTALKSSAVGNDKRLFFVRKGDFEKILAEAPDIEWKLILALCRFGGLRCPSEVLALRWQDITWKPGRIHITSCKTEGHDGGGSRTIPIFAELAPYLREAFEHARPGATYCIERHRLTSINLRTQVRRFIRRAGLTPWERTLQNLRASRATELSEQYPIRTVTAWLGHSLATATRHYLTVPEEHFERAAGVAQNPAQSDAERSAQSSKTQKWSKSETHENADLLVLAGIDGSVDNLPEFPVAPRGFEPLSPG